MSCSRPWTASWTPNPDAHLRLFCLPYAGGGAAVFRGWARHLRATIDIVPILLPGRESRSDEPPYLSIADLVPALTDGIAPYLDRPFALFGHSMGALVAFETAHALVARGRVPAHLVVAGRRGPQRPSCQPPCHLLPDEEFIQQMTAYHGTPAEVLQCPEVLGFYLPILRADFTVCETHVYTPRPPLPLPITVYGGERDAEVTLGDLQAWALETSRPCRVRLFPGDHFFIRQHRVALVETLEADLAMQHRAVC